MPEKRAIPDTKKNAKKCRCQECPVYNECLDKNNGRLFCSRGSTKCTIEKKDAYAYAAPTKLNTGLIVYFIVKKVLQQKKNVATKSINYINKISKNPFNTFYSLNLKFFK